MQSRSKWLMLIPVVVLLILLACGNTGGGGGGGGNGGGGSTSQSANPLSNQYSLLSFSGGSINLTVNFIFPPNPGNINELYGWFYVGLKAGKLSVNTNDARVQCVIKAASLGFEAYSSGTPVAYIIEDPQNLAHFLIVGYGCYQAFHAATPYTQSRSSTSGVDIYGEFYSSQLQSTCLPKTSSGFSTGGCRSPFGNRLNSTSPPPAPR